jgi:hypothetical protein
MYNGPYERESVLRKSTCYKIFEEQTRLRPGEDDLVTRSFKVVGANNKYIGFKKTFANQTKIFKQCKKNEQGKIK